MFFTIIFNVVIVYHYILKLKRCLLGVAENFSCDYNVMDNSGLWLKVDASCRQNDPRKQLNWLWARCSLDVRPAAKSERSSSGERELLRSEPSSRRVWGRKPGQLGCCW